MANPRAIARALSRSERAQVKAAIKAGDELGYNRNYTRGLVKFGQEGMTPEARMARAREMGFDTETPLYHGTFADVDKFDPANFGTNDYGWHGSGVYTASPADFANNYAGAGASVLEETPRQQQKFLEHWDKTKGNGNVMPLVVRGTVATPPRGSAYLDRFPEADALRVQYDGHTETAIRNPTNIRSPFATFDPARANRRDLLAGVVPVAAAAGAGALAMQPQDAEAAPRIPKGITAYHGSPHTFDRFDMSKIGTGEGAQAYGHGLYFAENENIARGYRNKLSGPDNIKPDEQAIAAIQGEWEDTLAKIRAAQGQSARNTPEQDALYRHLDALHARAVADTIERNPSLAKGAMYQVQLNADPEDMLNWDAPISDQTEQVRRALGWTPDAEAEYYDAKDRLRQLRDAAWESTQRMYDNKQTPEDWQILKQWHDPQRQKLPTPKGAPALDERPQNLVRGESVMMKGATKPQVTDALKERGIPGIKFLDGSSRKYGEGTRNYVMFDDKLVDILKRYGIAAGATGVAAGVAGAPQEAQAQTLQPPQPSALARALAREAPRFNAALDTSLDVASFFDPTGGYATETARALKDLPAKVGPAGAVALAPLTGATEALASIGQLPELGVAGGRALARALARPAQPRGSGTYRKKAK